MASLHSHPFPNLPLAIIFLLVIFTGQPAMALPQASAITPLQHPTQVPPAHASAHSLAPDNSLLKSLVPSTGTLFPAFSSHAFDYGMTLPAGTRGLSLKAVTAGGNATLTLNGAPVDSGVLSAAVPLQVGANNIAIQVTPQDGTTSRTYRITALVPAVNPGSDNLQALTDPSRFQATPTPPQNFIDVAGRLFFTADSSVHGTELWTSDGTPEGTTLVKDINPGTGSIYIFEKAVVGNTLYFSLSKNVHIDNTELWKSDGTAEGTVRVRDMPPSGDSPSNVSELTACGGMLYFTFMDAPGHLVLWKSDGSEAGTLPVMELDLFYPANYHAALTSVGNTLFFASAGDLWKTDGTPTGTRLVKELPEPPDWPKAVGDTLYFSIPNGEFVQLWKSDGTEAGTRMVKDILPASVRDYYLPLTAIGSVIYFQAYGSLYIPELWRSDGTPAGTMRLRDYMPDFPWSRPGFRESGGTLYVTDDLYPGQGLWKTDGTAEGSVRIWNPEGSSAAYPSRLEDFRGLASLGGSLYLGISNILWKSDGTEDGLALVKSFQTGENGQGPSNLTVVGNVMFFEVSNGPRHRELWKSDGTDAGTVMVKDFSSRPQAEIFSDLTVAGDRLYFLDSSSGIRLWTSDGTSEGTRQLWNTWGSRNSPNSLPRLNEVDGSLLFSEWPTPVSSRVLWKSGGTPFDTEWFRRFDSGADTLRDLTATAVMGTAMYFTAFDTEHGYELWKSDGTGEGTVMVRDIRLGSGSSEPGNLTVVDGTLYFTARDGNGGRNLWKSDGTETGTVRIDFHPEERLIEFGCLSAVGSVLYFTASGNGYDFELWKSDGTCEGTVKLTDRLNLEIHHPLAVGNILYFQANGAYRELKPQLWKSDGTPEGTVLVKEIYPWKDSGTIHYLGVLNDVLYFRASDDSHGAELWKTDGTGEGTVMMKDISPGPASGSPSDALVMDGCMYFQASDGIHGSELWKSDGTAEGTVMIRDIAEGSGDSSPVKLTRMGSKIHFIATTESGGASLYIYDTAVEVPTVRNPQVRSLTGTSAILTAEVTDEGNSPVSACGIVYAPADINANPQPGGVGVIQLSHEGGAGPLQVQATSLQPGTVYAYRGYAINSHGTAYSPLAVLIPRALNSAESWRDTYFMTLDDSGVAADNADPDNDGIVNLLERAFRLHPLQSGLTTLIPGTGTTGLPHITTTEGPAGPVLTLEYIRQKNSANSGLTYTPQFASDPGAPWQDFTGLETVESIDANWERVIVRDAVTDQPRRFGRVSVGAESQEP